MKSIIPYSIIAMPFICRLWQASFRNAFLKGEEKKHVMGPHNVAFKKVTGFVNQDWIGCLSKIGYGGAIGLLDLG